MPKGNAIAAAVLASSGGPGGGGSGRTVSGGLSPLVASYQQMYSVNRPYSPLPRPPKVFLDGAFGPFEPIIPMPIDPPQEDSGRPPVRRFQYPVGANLPIGVPGTEGGFKLAPFDVLRSLANDYSVARSCVEKCKSEIVGLDWDVIPTPEAEHAMADDEKARSDWEKRRAKVVEFFSHPDSDRAKYPTFGSWLSALLEDRFVIDAVAIHIAPPRKKGAGPFGSDIASLDIIDASLVRPLLNTLGATPRPIAPAYEIYAWGVPRVDMLSVITEADKAELDEPITSYRADQLIYMRETPRVQSPYGFSRIEKALLPIQIGLSRQKWQSDYYTDGSVPAQWITPGPDISTPQQIRQLQEALNQMAGDIGAKHRIIVLPPGSKADPQKPIPLADQTDEWLLSQVTMPFGLTPLDLGVTPRVSAIQSPGQSQELSNVNSDKGSQTRVEPVTADLKAVIFDFVIQELFKQKDMEWSWGLTDRGKNRAAMIQEHVQLIDAGIESIDEARTDLGKTPWGLPETSVPMVVTQMGPVPLSAVAGDDQPQQALAAGQGQQAQQGQAALAGKKPQAALPAKKPQDNELTTPAHEGARDLPATPAESKASAPRQDAAKQAAELEILGRFLRKGRDPLKFRADHLPAVALEAAAKALPEGHAAAVEAARRAVEAKRRQERRDEKVAVVAALVTARLGKLVAAYQREKMSSPDVIDRAVAAMSDGYEQTMTAGSADASGDYPDTPVQEPQAIQAQAQAAGEGQRGYFQGLLQDIMGGLSAAKTAARLGLFAATLRRQYNRAYGETVHAAHPDYYIEWSLGPNEDHCAACIGRAGKRFTIDSLPGWPGDGGFGGGGIGGGGTGLGGTAAQENICAGGPNCFPAGTLVQAADVELGFKRWYEGEIVEILTADGHELAGTPNHPVLTRQGWVPLGLLKEGDDLVRGSFAEPVAVDPDVQAVPAGIEKVVDALADVAPTMRLPVLPVDFHGDGAGGGEVDVVGTDRELPLHGDAAHGKPLREFVLSGADVGEEALACLRHADLLDGGSPAAATGGMGGSDLGSALLGGALAPDPAPGVGGEFAPGGVCPGCDALPVFLAPLRVEEAAGLAETADRDAVLSHDLLDECRGAPRLSSQMASGLSVDVALDKVLLVKRRPFSGHVYNLQTNAGWYVANGILVHNCHCSVTFVQNGRAIATGTNTQRPGAQDYYAQQRAKIMQARAEAQANRQAFVNSLPQGPAIRARTRDQLRQQVADLANARIRAAGGYQGVSVYPEDVPAKIIAQMLPPDMAGAAGASTPRLDVAAAVDAMFAKRLSAMDMTKAELAAIVKGVIADLEAAGVSAPPVDASVVYDQLSRNYRPEGIGWVRDQTWVGPVAVPLDDIDWEHLDTWAAAHDHHHVDRFEHKIRAGHEPHPVVMVQVPGSRTLKVIDGHHRSLARKRLGQPVPAYVGLADSDAATSPWFRCHLYQVHSGGDPLNKALGDEDPSRVAFLLIRGRNEDGKRRFLLQYRDDGTWGLPGGKAHDGETPWDAAVRESREELGTLPDVSPAAGWTRLEDDHVVWTFLVDLPGLFAPSGDGGEETAGWGWFRRRDVDDMDLHPAMRRTWKRLDFDDDRLGGKDVEVPASGRRELIAPQDAAAVLVPSRDRA